MKRNDVLNSKKNPQQATFSFSPKGKIYVSPVSEDFPLEKGSHPVSLFQDVEFRFLADRFYLYGLSRDKETNLYSTSYQRASDEVLLYERANGGQSRQIAKETPVNLKKEYKLSTGALITAIIVLEGHPLCVDVKFQASSRSEWIDFSSACRRDRKFPDFTIGTANDKDFGTVYKFSHITEEPVAALQAYIDEIAELL